MFELLRAGGWVMWPILLASALALTITLERLWALRPSRVLPEELSRRVPALLQAPLSAEQLNGLSRDSALGEVLAAGLAQRAKGRDAVLDALEDAGRHAVHDLERFLNTLGTIAAVSPLLGLLGTVTGMIRTFQAITTAGVGDPAAMAGGIAEALLTTAAGLIVAIPALVAYRYLRGRVDKLSVRLEKEGLQFVRLLEKATVRKGAA